LAQCVKCGKKRLSLRIDKETGLCPSCAEEIRREQEMEAINILAEIKELAKEVNNSKQLSAFFLGYDRCLSLLKRASEIQDNISHFNIINGDFHHDYVNNKDKEQSAIRDAMKRTFSHIHRSATQKSTSKAEIKEMLEQLKEDITIYRDRFDEENAKNAAEWFPLLCEKCGIFLCDNNLATDIDALDGQAFEYWCAGILEKNGFTNVQVTGGSGDQGVDIIAEKDEIRYAIQCKCYSSNLGNTPIQEVNAGKTLYDCHVGVVMTNRYFTKSAENLAKATGTLLWNRDKILQFASIKKLH